MKDIPESEARELLSSSSDCLDIGSWVPTKHSGYIFKAECGLTRDGIFTNLHVDILYSHRSDIKVTHMVFTVFRKTTYGLERVFQLDIKSNPKVLKVQHDQPHYHWGSFREKGDLSWMKWTFEQALDFFKSETKINFNPSPSLPGFELK